MVLLWSTREVTGKKKSLQESNPIHRGLAFGTLDHVRKVFKLVQGEYDNFNHL